MVEEEEELVSAHLTNAFILSLYLLKPVLLSLSFALNLSHNMALTPKETNSNETRPWVGLLYTVCLQKSVSV